MRPYGVKVLLVEPGAHKTQLVLGVTAGVMKMWERTPQQLKDELGEKSLNSGTDQSKASVHKSILSSL